MITSITFLHHGIHWTLYFNIVYNKISILLNHLRTSSFPPSVNFSTNRLIFVRPLRAVILFIWEQWGISTMLSTTIQAIPTLWEAGMAQWQEFSSPTAVSSHRGVELLVLVLATRVFFGYSCFLHPPPPKKKKPTFQIQLELETVDQKNHFVVCSELHYNYHSHHYHYDPMIKFCQRKTNRLIFLEFWLFGEVDWRLLIPLTTFPLFLFLCLFLIFLPPRIRDRCDELFIWC